VISLIALGLVIAGVLILSGALVSVRRLIGRLPSGRVRSRWFVMVALIAVFILGYLAYADLFWGSHSTLVDLTVPSVFFLGACFVLLATTLALQTAMDVMRISVLERDAATDALTGAFNRRYLDRRLIEEAAGARRYGLPLAVMLLDIDHFKQVNDRHGHQAGDQVLAAVAQRVAEQLRESDVLARYGGEEFLVIAPHTPLPGAAELAERVRRSIESGEFSLPNEPAGRGIRVTASIGVASTGDGRDDAEALVHAADENLLRAKREGRNRVIAGQAGATGAATS